MRQYAEEIDVSYEVFCSDEFVIEHPNAFDVFLKMAEKEVVQIGRFSIRILKMSIDDSVHLCKERDLYIRVSEMEDEDAILAIAASYGLRRLNPPWVGPTYMDESAARDNIEDGYFRAQQLEKKDVSEGITTS